ncbi:MAG: leucine-rich repeat domain-containing protein [Clostridia bacterium]|nr:leucine-rich repeat domain-containing protein [Clostridia bacterium]
MIHSKNKSTKLIIGLLAVVLTLCIFCVMLISNGKSNVGVAYAESTAVETTDTTTESTETEEMEIDYSTLFQWSVDSNNNITITKYIGTDTDVIIPADIDGNPVTSIGCQAFYNCSSLTSVNILEGVTSIGQNAFRGCSGINNVKIPESVTKISSYAFYNCSSLTGVYITDINSWCKITFADWYANPLYYAKNLYLNDELVTEVNILDGLTKINNYIFTNCINLTKVNIPTTVKTIGAMAFYNCKNILNIYMPESITKVESQAFYNCSGLTGVHITSIDSWCKITFADWYANPLYYAKNLFLNNELIEDLIIPEGVSEIKYGVFYNCINLMNVFLPKSLVKIDGVAFNDCSNLKNISFSSDITNIGDSAFLGCNALEKVFIEDIDNWCNISFGNNFSTPLNNGKTELYLNNKLVTDVDLTNTTKVGNYVFYNCKSLTSVTMSNSVISVGTMAFYNCENLVSVNLSDNITIIGTGAFAGCKSLSDIDISNNIDEIGNDLFKNCISLTNIDLPMGIVKIGDSAFYGCSQLEKVFIPESVTSIGRDVFYNCANLKEIKLPNKISSIAMYTFYGCKNLIEIILPENVTSIGSGAFYNCENLTYISIPQNVTSIGSNAFYGCSSLKTVYIDNAELASEATSNSSQGYLFSAKSSYGARQAIAVIGENPTVGSYITDNYANTEVITYNGNTYTVYATHEHAWELDYKIEPDCVTDGFEQYVCDTCGLVKNNVIPALGHTESDWIIDVEATTDCAGHKYIECTVCKEVLLEEEIPALGIVLDEEINYQHSCSFHNNLTLNFYIPAEDLNKYDSFYLFVEQDIYANGIWGVQSFEIHKSELTSNGYKFVFTGIGAADAGNEIRATLYAQLGDVQYKSLVDVYSVKTYAYNRLAKSTDSQFKTLLVDMLNYCSAAQVYFGVNTDNLVNADLTEEQKALATTVDSTVADTSSTVALEGATAQIKAKSIVFNSNIEVKFYMDLNGYQDLTGIALRITYTDGLGVTHVTVVESTEFMYENSQESYTAKLTDLNSAELRAQIQVEIMLDEQVISDTLYYSVETYVYNRLNKSTDENFKALLKVLMKYSDSANKYFYKGGN